MNSGMICPALVIKKVLIACHNSVDVSALSSGFWDNNLTWCEAKHALFFSAMSIHSHEHLINTIKKATK